VDVPKVSEEHKTRRRDQILDGARRCFARHGYEGATVARLEAETGLSRGAIFNYFPNKDAIFLAIAQESSDRLTEIWLGQGFRAMLDALVEEDPDWLAVQLEAIRRLRTDPDFQRAVAEHDEAGAPARRERLRRLAEQGVRDDVALESIGAFLSTVANGLALRLTVGDPLPDLDDIAELVEHGVRGRATRKQRGEWKQTTSRTRRTQPSSRRSSAA
jgi:TetR/AcrR family transcriptional regulator, transcriptional repressor of aconitase